LWATVGRQDADLEEKVKDGLKNVNNVTEVVIKNKVVVSVSASEEEDGEIVYNQKLASNVRRVSTASIPVGMRHFANSGIFKACCSMVNAAYRSSSESKSWAENSHVPTAWATAAFLSHSIWSSLEMYMSASQSKICDVHDSNLGSIDSPTESGLQIPFIRPETMTSRRYA
jgi:hypothetical protein